MLVIPQTLLEDGQRRASLALRTGSRKVLGLVLLGVAVVMAGVWGVRVAARPRAPEGISEQRAALIRALGSVRLTEGRLVGFEYAPVKPLPPEWRTNRVAEAIRAISREAEFRPSSRTLADKGIVALLNGNAEAAVADLQRALLYEPDNLEVLSDISAAYMSDSLLRADRRALLPAFEFAERAHTAQPNFAAAAFNRATALEYLGLSGHAHAAWKKLIDTDVGSSWKLEDEEHFRRVEPNPATIWERCQSELLTAAQQNNQKLVDKLVRRFPQPARRLVEDQLFAEWATKLQNGHQREANAAAAAAASIGSALHSWTGDGLVLEEARLISRLTEGKKLLLASAHLQYEEGRGLYRKDRVQAAEPFFLQASLNFELVGSPFALLARFYRDACGYYGGRSTGTVQDLRTLVSQARESSFNNLSGWASWLLALISLEEMEPSKALGEARSSLLDFKRTREVDNQASLLSIVANCLDNLGEPAEAWIYRLQALRLVAASSDGERQRIIYGAAARAAARDELFNLALALQDEVLKSVMASGDHWRIAEECWWRAMTFEKAHEHVRARQFISCARTHSTQIPEPAIRDRTVAGVAVTEASILREVEPKRSVVLLTNALRLYRRANYSYLLTEIYLERARAQSNLSRVEDAEADLRAGIEEFERQSQQLGDSRFRSSHFERASKIFEEMISFQLDHMRRIDVAFRYAEESRARLLKNVFSADRVKSDSAAMAGQTIEDVQRALPRGVVLLYFAVQEKRTLVWSVRRESFKFEQLNVAESMLTSFSSRLSEAFRRRDRKAFDEQMRQLSSILAGPITRSSSVGDKIILVPDRCLWRVPFSALVMPNGHYLAEDHAIAYEPSSVVYIRALARARGLRVASVPKILAFGDPSFDRKLFPGLGKLPQAEAEAIEIASRVPGSRSFLGREATIQAFFSNANAFDVLHFAGHAVGNTVAPLRSSLILASAGPGDSGELSAADISAFHFTRPMLVVLSSCGAAEGSVQTLEGVQDLARPFLVAGVPAVLVNQWDLGDRGSMAFFDLFYDALLGGSQAMEALRLAQVGMMHNADPSLRKPEFWAGFTLFGSTDFIQR